MKGWRMVRGDYRFEADPARMLDDVESYSSLNHVQHVFSKGNVTGGHTIRRDNKGTVRCSYRACVLNVGREWQKKRKKKA